MVDAVAVREETALWSHSRLQTYARCPRSYRLRYVEGVDTKPTTVLTRGILVHEFAEAYGRHCVTAGLERDWGWAREQAASYPDDVRELCIAFSEQMAFNADLVVADAEGVERWFEVELPDGLGVFRGRVDLVEYNPQDRALLVTDYKSGWGPRERADQPPPQLLCYAWALTRADFPNVREVTVANHYVRSGQRHSWLLWSDDLRPHWAVSLVRRVLADDEFRPTPSPQACALCDVAHACPLVQADPLVTFTDDAGAQACLEQLVALRARTNELTEALKAWTAEHGEVRAAGMVAGRRPPRSVVEHDGRHIYDGEFVLREGVQREQAMTAFIAAGLPEQKVRDVFYPDPDPKRVGTLVKALQADADPFGSGEVDDAVSMALGLVEERLWRGREYFRIDEQ